MGRRKQQADCCADTRGGRWAGIPVCVIDSAAYRDCSVYARAVLVELVARMSGYNNGKLAMSQRELKSALRCHPRKVVQAISDLLQHGLIDITTEGTWKPRMARQYRITFISTKGAAATNDYKMWTPIEKIRATNAEAAEAQSSSTLESASWRPASNGELGPTPKAQKIVTFEKPVRIRSGTAYN